MSSTPRQPAIPAGRHSLPGACSWQGALSPASYTSPYLGQVGCHAAYGVRATSRSLLTSSSTPGRTGCETHEKSSKGKSHHRPPAMCKLASPKPDSPRSAQSKPRSTRPCPMLRKRGLVELLWLPSPSSRRPRRPNRTALLAGVSNCSHSSPIVPVGTAGGPPDTLAIADGALVRSRRLYMGPTRPR